MTSIEYINFMIGTCDKIYVDTASLMESDSFEQFILNCKPVFIAKSKKMIVSNSVCAELIRLLSSSKPEKRICSQKAIDLITSNSEIFKVENEPMSDAEVERAFADAQILSELTLNKSDYNQLLITNDRRLSIDAFLLNQQYSCKGHQVKVCYINRWGELRKCGCVDNKTSAKPKPIIDLPTRENFSEKSAPTSIPESKKVQNTTKASSNIIGISACIISFLGGALLGVAKPHVNRSISRAFRLK